MIKSFKKRNDAENIWNENCVKKLDIRVQERANRKLLIIDTATVIDDLRKPASNRLKKLEGDRKGQWSIRVNDKYRICFNWQDDDAYDVEFTDYH